MFYSTREMETKELSCNSFVEFYLLDMIDYHIHNDSTLLPSERHFLPSVQHLVRKLEEYKSEFNEAFALRLRDYLWYAAIGEMRHSGRIIGVYIPEMERQQSWDRYDVYSNFADDYPPTPENIAVMKDLYFSYEWGGTFGGESWGKIVEAVEMYETATNSAFIDHCADLQHNGGIAFNKSVPFWDRTGEDGLMNFLNWKFNARSVIFDLPQHFGQSSITHVVSRSTIYLMNKLFAVSGRTPYWFPEFRYKPSWFKWDLELTDQYTGNDTFSEHYDRMACAHCDCGLDSDPDYNYHIDGYTYCNDCVTYCFCCHETYVGESGGYETPSGENCCEGCFNEYYMYCESCGEVYDYEESGYCDDCYSDLCCVECDEFAELDGDGLCEGCSALCDNCEDFNEDSRTIINLDRFGHDTYLSDCTELLCPDCIKKFLNAGWRMFYSNEGLVMSTNIDKVLEYPYEELLGIVVGEEFTHFNLIPLHIKQGGF